MRNISVSVNFTMNIYRKKLEECAHLFSSINICCGTNQCGDMNCWCWWRVETWGCGWQAVALRFTTTKVAGMCSFCPQVTTVSTGGGGRTTNCINCDMDVMHFFELGRLRWAGWTTQTFRMTCCTRPGEFGDRGWDERTMWEQIHDSFWMSDARWLLHKSRLADLEEAQIP